MASDWTQYEMIDAVGKKTTIYLRNGKISHNPLEFDCASCHMHHFGTCSRTTNCHFSPNLCCDVTLDSKGGERVTQACRYVMVDGRREANPTVVSFITLNVVALFML